MATTDNNKATRASVDLGLIKTEGFLLPEKFWTKQTKYGISKTQAVLLTHPHISRDDCASVYRRIVKSKVAESYGVKDLVVQTGLSIYGENQKVDLILLSSLPLFLKICKKLGSKPAEDLIDDLVGLSLEQLFSDAFKVKFEAEDRQDWLTTRQQGKETRRQLTDAIASYIERHPEMSDNDKRWIYSNVSERINLAIFGRRAKKLAADLNAEPKVLRDAFTDNELLQIRKVEDSAMIRVDAHDLHPMDAVEESVKALLIPVVERVEAIA